MRPTELILPRWAPLSLLTAALCSSACTSTSPPAARAEPAEGTKPAAPELDVWAGVAPIEAGAGDLAAELVPVPGPTPPTGVGERVTLPFPPPAPPSKQTQDQAPTGPLQLLRTSPIMKEPGLVASVSAVFNQPMIPLAAVDELELQRSPLSITPQPPGKFRWLGTQMIAFEPAGRLPFSTTYTAAVAAGERSTSGAQLGKSVQWQFSTPTLELEQVQPAEWGHAELDSIIVVRFNQDIQRERLAAAARLSGGGSERTLQLVTPAEYDALPEPYRAQALAGRPERGLVLRPAGALAADTEYTLKLPAGAYGEGPNPSKALSAKFRTYPPLRLSAPRCGERYSWDCSPTSGVTLGASTDVLDDPELATRVRVSPEVPGLEVSGGGGIHLTGSFKGLGTYTIEVDPGVRDRHGQTLQRPFKTTITLKPLDWALAIEGNTTGEVIVLEPGHSGVLNLQAAGLRAVERRARAMNPDQLRAVLGEYGRDDEWQPFLREGAKTANFNVAASRAEVMRLPQDVRALATMPGSLLLLGARSEEIEQYGYKHRQQVRAIVEVTRLGVSAALDSGRGVVMVTDLETGEPLPGVALSLHAQDTAAPHWSGTSDARGLAEIRHAGVHAQPYLLAQMQGDLAYVPLQATIDGSYGSWQHQAGSDAPQVFFFADREPHKPGETVHLSGVAREQVRGPAGGVRAWGGDLECDYVVTSPRGQELLAGKLRVGPLGTFSVDVPIPADGELGTYQFQLKFPHARVADAPSFWHGFTVEAYRAPEFAVTVERAAAASLVYGDTLEAEVRASYLHGAAMNAAAVHYTLRRSDADFRPPGAEHEGFSFGPSPRPWWTRGFMDLWGGGPAELLVRQGSGETDARGVFALAHLLQAKESEWGVKPEPAQPDADAPEGPPDPPSAGTYTLEALVTDQNRQAIAGRQSFVVHAADEYVGLRSDRSVYKEGERARVEAVVVDLAGQRVRGRPVQLALVRSETRRRAVEAEGRWTYAYESVDVPVGACELTSDAAPASCELAVDKAGSYVLRAEIKDTKGRRALTRHNLYVYGKDAVVWDQDQRRVDLVPDRRSYEPGEVATILLRSPFDRARGLAIIARDGIVEHRELLVEGGAATLEIPLTEHMIPGVEVAVLLVRGRVEVPGAPAGQDLGRPAVAVGKVALELATTAKKIALTLKPERHQLAPKETLKLEIQARGPDGAGKKAAVAVMVVDEGVLSLMAYKTPDPLSFFHSRIDPGLSLYDLRQHLLARREDEPGRRSGTKTQQKNGHTPPAEPMADGNGLGLSGYGRGGGGVGVPMMARAASPSPDVAEATGESAAPLDASQAMNQAVALRALFATTAYFNPEVMVGPTGTATIEIPMPENLTTFRVMAVAVDPERPDHFGSAETQVQVRKPIMLRPSLPRFASFGDRFEASVMVDNQSELPQAIVVGARGSNVVMSGATSRALEIPAGQSREVRFPMAVDQVGTMRLQFAALSNGGRDATEASLPVLYPATRQAFADYGVTDTSVLRAIKVPEGVLAAFGGLELGLSSTALNGLEDAVKYLVGYDYACTEQLASRLLPIFVLGPVLEQFPIAGLEDLAARQQIGAAGLARLAARQNVDGGFRFWDTRDRSWPYLSAWTTFSLLEGKKAGFKVEPEVLRSALDYLERFVAVGEATPWGRYYDHTSRALALWLLSREGRGEALFERVYAKRDEVPLYARALLMSAAHAYGREAPRAALLKDFRARVTETARTAHFAERVREAEADGLQLLMHSDVQTDAIALMSILEVAPDDPLLPKVIAGIMDERDPQRGGRWATTHANAWALLAASRYFSVVEQQVPDYVARVWLDQSFAGEHAFKGRSMAVVEQQVPMSRLLAAPPKEVLLAKDGPGKLYYRLGLRYAPADLAVKAQQQGFTVSRSYEPLAQGGEPADPDSVRRLDDGSYEVKAGALVRVNLTLVARDRANFVVVDDPLPAGFEGQNPRFSTTLQDVSGGVVDQRVDLGGEAWTQKSWWFWRPWWRFSHTELRDDRMLLFADHLPAGVYTYSYTARATTLGEFQLPPVRAEAMYTPELFGHSASSRVRVVE